MFESRAIRPSLQGPCCYRGHRIIRLPGATQARRSLGPAFRTACSISPPTLPGHVYRRRLHKLTRCENTQRRMGQSPGVTGQFKTAPTPSPSMRDGSGRVYEPVIIGQSIRQVTCSRCRLEVLCYTFTKDNAAFAHTSEKPTVPIRALTSCKSVQNTKHPKPYWTTAGTRSMPHST
jgi:hypothetical protein